MKISNISFLKKQVEPRKDIIIRDNNVALEAFRTLRTNLQFALVDSVGCKKIIVTSSVVREGKSTVAVNLAISLAAAKFKTLIVDCDMRKPRLHKFLHKTCIPGLSDCLIGKNTFAEVVVPYGDAPNLDFVFSGRVPPNAVELLGSNEMKELITKLEGVYDYIIFDTPPVLSVSDSVILSNRVDGVLIVCRERVTHKNELVSTINAFTFVNAKILGFILNNAKLSKKKDYRYEYYGKSNI